ncbi:hypothetical protein FB192DRAFT_1383782 [Mucor lusitanicus]|uniref:Uncharacterized protein n=2 Tax=Mucor circinelloides f. lusitanicus TaxID=29924 RepID=A0A162QAG9_MUCCL|nr:hypothetical protein FB192DRAFT_1383782 [Mucor lusitanicus]OAD00280.1 hypothetical protein MUCCIDRAFT_190709 [Mucor lusitanicus CBS 277.49]
MTVLGQNDAVKPSETNGTISHEKGGQDFVNRITSIPLVKDSVETAHTIANKTSLGRFALSTANSTFSTVAQYASNNQPLQSYYQAYVQPQIKKADAFGCRSLDTLQTKVPIINQPSAEIIHTLTEPPNKIINGVKVKINSTVETVTHPAHVVVQNANKRLTTAVDNFEGVVDRYLPPPASNGHSVKSNGTTTAKHTNKDSAAGTTTTTDSQVMRVYGVLNEASRRLTVKVSDQVSRSTSGIPKSREDVSQLALVQKLQENIKFIQDTLAQSVTVYSEAAQRHLPNSVTLGATRASELVAQFTQNIQQQVAGLTEYIKSPQVPEWLKQRLTTVVGSVNQQLASIKTELARTDINYIAKAKGIAGKLQEQILPLLENMNSQIKTYVDLVKEKAQHEMNTPLHYFGLDQKVKAD